MADKSQTKEQSVKSSYTVVYMLKNKEWEVLGKGGWSEVHLCSDLGDGSFRMLAWSVETQEVLLNSNINQDCVYKSSKKANFHSFTDENGAKYGLGFHKSEDALLQAQSFLEAVCEVIQDITKTHAEPSEDGLQSVSTESDLIKKGLISREDFKPLGVLKILPPKPKKHKDSDAGILDPHDVRHERHGYFDPATKKFKGNFPAEWLAVLNKQFGVPPKQLQSSKVEGYGYQANIPQVLIDLKTALKNNNGYSQVGIFRLAPDQTENDTVKNLIDSGSFRNQCDVNVTANLIKVWFRDLPVPLLNAVKPEVIEQAQKIEGVIAALEKFPEPNLSILLWLWDLCVEVAEYKDTNKMGSQNLAIVIGPNLFNTDSIQNPMAAMTLAGKVVTFFQRGIEWRQSLRA